MKAVENEAALEIQNESKQQHLKEVNEARNEKINASASDNENTKIVSLKR